MNVLIDNTPLNLVPLSAEQVRAMLDAGILDKDPPIELVEGLLVDRREHGRGVDPTEPHVTAFVDDLELPLFPINTGQYEEMARRGILEDGAPIELLDGMLVWKDRRDSHGDIMTAGENHTWVLKLLLKRLREALANLDVHLMSQLPVRLPAWNEPEPDVCIIRGQEEDYFHHPRPADILLAVEVSDSSLRTDRRQKLEAYASAGIPIYWVFNVKNQTVEVYSEPVAAERRYNAVRTFQRNETIDFELLGRQVCLDLSTVFLGPAKDA